MSVKAQHSLGHGLPVAFLNQRTARRVLKKYRGVARKRTFDSYWRLKKLVPTIKGKENISKLDVVLEAISYIQSLQCNLQLTSRQFC